MNEMDIEDEASLEVYGANQNQIDKILKYELTYEFLAELAGKYGDLGHEINNRSDLEKLALKYKFLAELAGKYGDLGHEINNRSDLEKLALKYKFLAELAGKYGKLAHEINNRSDLEKLADPTSIAIAVQILVSSYTMIEGEILRGSREKK